MVFDKQFFISYLESWTNMTDPSLEIDVRSSPEVAAEFWCDEVKNIVANSYGKFLPPSEAEYDSFARVLGGNIEQLLAQKSPLRLEPSDEMIDRLVRELLHALPREWWFPPRSRFAVTVQADLVKVDRGLYLPGSVWTPQLDERVPFQGQAQLG